MKPDVARMIEHPRTEVTVNLAELLHLAMLSLLSRRRKLLNETRMLVPRDFLLQEDPDAKV